MAKLKPCPVCGEAPVIKTWESPCDWMPPTISCYVCPKCGYDGFGDGSDDEEYNCLNWNEAVDCYNIK